MNRKKLEILLGSLTIVIAVFAWLSVQRAVIVSDSSTWLVPMLLFSAYIILICLDIIVFRNMLALELVLICSMLLSLPFAFSWLQIIAILLSAYFIFLASRSIRDDMEVNTKVSVWKSLQTGRTYLLISISLLITMQYFVVLSNFNGVKKVPNFDASFITKKIAIPFLSSVNPQFKALKDETLTVDQFILQTQASNQGSDFSAVNDQMLDAQLPANLTQVQKEMIKAQAKENFSNTQSQVAQKNQELILEIGRKQLSDTIGVTVIGSEKISDVFTGLINNKINDYFNPKIAGNEKNSVLPIIFSIVLLLIIYPVGVLLCMVIFLIAKLVIIALLKSKVLNVKIITVQKEILE